MGHGGKGDTRRQRQISKEEEELRWELAFGTKNNPERKEDINKRLKEITDEKKTGCV